MVGLQQYSLAQFGRNTGNIKLRWPEFGNPVLPVSHWDFCTPLYAGFAVLCVSLDRNWHEGIEPVWSNCHGEKNPTACFGHLG